MATQQDFDTIWGSTGAVTEPSVAKQNTGWIAEIPPHQTQNWWQERSDLQHQYNQERGVPEWNTLFTYQKGAAIIGSDDRFYISSAAANNGNDPVGDDGTWWFEYTLLVQPPRGYIDGFRMVVDVTDPTHDIVFNPGEAAFTQDGQQPGAGPQRRFSNSAAMTKRLDATWVAGSGNGMRGLTTAIDTWYPLFAIVDSSPLIPVMDFGLAGTTDLDATGLFTVATTYDHYRQIGWLRTSLSSVQFKPFYQSPNDLSRFKWDTPSEHRTPITIPSGANTLTALAPPDATAIDQAHVSWTGGSNADVRAMISPIAMNDITPNATQYDWITTREGTDGSTNNLSFEIDLNSSSAYRWRWDGAGSNALWSVRTTGYRYNRGKE